MDSTGQDSQLERLKSSTGSDWLSDKAKYQVDARVRTSSFQFLRRSREGSPNVEWRGRTGDESQLLGHSAWKAVAPRWKRDDEQDCAK